MPVACAQGMCLGGVWWPFDQFQVWGLKYDLAAWWSQQSGRWLENKCLYWATWSPESFPPLSLTLLITLTAESRMWSLVSITQSAVAAVPIDTKCSSWRQDLRHWHNAWNLRRALVHPKADCDDSEQFNSRWQFKKHQKPTGSYRNRSKFMAEVIMTNRWAEFAQIDL